MCQCHTMCQSEGAMQVQVAHSKKFLLAKKNSYMGCQFFFSGGTPGGGGYEKKFVQIFSTPPPPMHTVGLEAQVRDGR